MPRFSKLLRHFGIAHLLGIEIDHRDADSVLHFAFPQVVQMALPIAVLFHVLGQVFRNENVAGVAAIHHALRDIDSSSRNV